MRLLEGTIHERIERHIKEICYAHVASSSCEVHETNESGQARVVCIIRDGDSAIQWNIGHEVGFPGLAELKSADGAILVFHGDGAVTAHIVECTATIDAKKLARKLKPQFRGTLVRLLSVCAIAGIDLEEAVFYAAYRKHSFGQDPVVAKLPIMDSPSPIPEGAVLLREWRLERPLEIPGLVTSKIQFRHIQLRDDGTGEVTLRPREA